MFNALSNANVGMIGALGVPFTPDLVTGLVEWLDASTVTGADGDPISTWVARVGSNGTSSGANRPQLFNSVVNGRNVLRFVTANATNSSGSVVVSGTTLTVFWVGTVNVNSVNLRAVSLGTGASADFGNVGYTAAVVLSSASSGNTFRPVRNSVTLSTSGAYTSNVALQIGSKYDGTNHTLYQDRVGKTPVACTGTFAITGFRIGGNINNSNYWSGDMCEILIYSTAVSDPDRLLIENYLSTKWGTP
jgi:hypothetical protein